MLTGRKVRLLERLFLALGSIVTRDLVRGRVRVDVTLGEQVQQTARDFSAHLRGKARVPLGPDVALFSLKGRETVRCDMNMDQALHDRVLAAAGRAGVNKTELVHACLRLALPVVEDRPMLATLLADEDGGNRIHCPACGQRK